MKSEEKSLHALSSTSQRIRFFFSLGRNEKNNVSLQTPLEEHFKGKKQGKTECRRMADMGGEREERVFGRRGLRELWKWKREKKKKRVDRKLGGEKEGEKNWLSNTVSGVGGRTGR